MSSIFKRFGFTKSSNDVTKDNKNPELNAGNGENIDEVIQGTLQRKLSVSRSGRYRRAHHGQRANVFDTMGIQKEQSGNVQFPTNGKNGADDEKENENDTEDTDLMVVDNDPEYRGSVASALRVLDIVTASN